VPACSDWTPAAVLPNLTADKAVEGDVIALAPCHDPRVVAFGTAHPKFQTFISRFTDAFHVPLRPVVLIVRDDLLPKLAHTEPLASFRDLVAMCVVPQGRALATLYPNGGHRLSYANTFWLYPWTLGTDKEYLVASTPALNGLHLVDQFYGQSSPEVPVKDLAHIDEPLFDSLIVCWRRHYLGKRPRWRDRALFRSLNMATNAAQLPAGIDTTLYDLGRTVALWVSAFETLAHPRKGNSGLRTVYPLLEAVSYQNTKVGRRGYVAYMTFKKPWPRRCLPCWLYGKLYQARCDFLHGNPVSPKTLNPSNLEQSLFWFAPCLYRMALTGFLKLTFNRKPPRISDAQKMGAYASQHARFWQFQRTIERALLKSRK
jgi:hypothetical protein